MLYFWFIIVVLGSTPFVGIYGGTDFASFSDAGRRPRPDLKNFIQISKKNFEVFLGSETPPSRSSALYLYQSDEIHCLEGAMLLS